MKAFCAWELFVSSPCKLLDASAPTEANSPACGSAQALPSEVCPLQPGLAPLGLSLQHALSGREQACRRPELF